MRKLTLSLTAAATFVTLGAAGAAQAQFYSGGVYWPPAPVVIAPPPVIFYPPAPIVVLPPPPPIIYHPRPYRPHPHYQTSRPRVWY